MRSELPFVVCDTILICLQRLGPWSNIDCCDDTQVILIRDKFYRDISEGETRQVRDALWYVVC